MHRYHFTMADRRASGKTVPAMHFDIVDYPGEWIERRDTEAERAYYDDAIATINKARVILVAIDAPYLMEDRADHSGDAKLMSEPGPFHEQRNRPDLIRRVLAEAFALDRTVDRRSDGPSRVLLHPPRLILFVPIRCEKYMATSYLRQSLAQAVVNGYRGVYDLMASADLRNVTTAVVTPVETTGCIVFDRWNTSAADDDPPALPTPQFRFGPSSTFAPVYCEQPVCYMLRFAIEEYTRQRIRNVVQGVKYVFDRDHRVHDAAAKFAKKCRQDDGFLIWQRGPLP